MTPASTGVRLRLQVALRIALATAALSVLLAALGVAPSTPGRLLPWVLVTIFVVWGILGVSVRCGWLKPGYWSGYSPVGNLCMSAGGLAVFVPPFFTGMPSGPRTGPIWARALYWGGAILLLVGIVATRRARLHLQRAPTAPG